MLGLTRGRVQIIIAIMLLTPAFLYWVLNEPRTPEEDAPAWVSSDVDYFMRDTQARKFNNQGTLSQVIKTQSLEHLHQHQVAELTQPVFTLFQQDGTVVTAQSETGILFDHEDKLVLEAKVKVTHNRLKGDTTQLNTPRLTFYHKQGIAETAAPVTFYSGQQLTTATGMTVDYNQQTAKLHSNVEGTFHVNKQ